MMSPPYPSVVRPPPDAALSIVSRSVDSMVALRPCRRFCALLAVSLDPTSEDCTAVGAGSAFGGGV
jgi:hypothetical protein